MRVHAVLRAVPAAFVLFLGPTASAEPVCVTVGVLPGNPAGVHLDPCAGPALPAYCPLVTVPVEDPLVYVGVCVPLPSGGPHRPA